MNAQEEPERNFSPTEFDRQRILCLEPGESVNAESGLFLVTRYRSEYVLIFTSQQKSSIHEFKTPKEIFYYLNEMA